MDKLLINLIDSNNIDKYYLYYHNKWEPYIFDWSITNNTLLQSVFSSLYTDELWSTRWFSSLLSGSNYAFMLDIPNFEIQIYGDRGKIIKSSKQIFQFDRFFHVHHIFSLYYSLNILPEDLSLILEFGAGTGYLYFNILK